MKRLAWFLVLMALAVGWTGGVVDARRQSAPGAPTIGTATAISRATVTFTAPASDGGSPITLYTATSSPGGFTATCKWSPCYVEGLSLSTSYTFTVRATNAIGQGSPSAASNSVQVSSALVPAPHATVWTGAGVDIPTRTTQCGATIAAATYGNGGTDASAGIQAAIDACPDDQVVLLGAGVFTLNNYVRLGNRKLLRGSGPGTTILQKRNSFGPPAVAGGKPTTNSNPLVVIGPSRFPQFNELGEEDMIPGGDVVNITSDAVKGAYTVTVPNGAIFAADQIVRIDQDDYTYSTWQRSEPQTSDYVLLALFTDTLFLPIKCVEKADDCIVGTGPRTQEFPNITSALAHSLPVPKGLSYWGREGRFTSEVKEIASVAGNTITFKTPFHADFTTAKVGQISWWTGNNVHTRWSGLEDLSLTGGSSGSFNMANAAYSWVKNVDVYQYGQGNDISASYKVEVRDSLIRDTLNPVPGSGGYLLTTQKGTAEVLFENNVVTFGEKALVVRASGAGSVFAYNYVDDIYIGYSLAFPEVGINSSHYVGSHSVLFEGNYAHNYDQDDTWGSSIYNVVLRNHLTGNRGSFPDSGAAVRAGASSRGSYWAALIGNVLGLAGYDATWIYEDPVDGTYGTSGWMWGIPAGKLGTIYRIGYGTGEPANTMRGDPKVKSTFIREGNYDYVTQTQKWDRASGSFTVPNSLYLAGKPPFFDAGHTWPWVNPGAGTKTYTLPAKVRHDAMVAAATAPSAPVINLARLETATSAMVAFYPPVSNGGRVITGYTVTSSPGGLTAVVTGATAKPQEIYITGLAPDETYTFTVTASNTIGTSAASAASNSVTTGDEPPPPPTGDITRVQKATGVVGNTTTANVSAVFSSNVTTGNLLVVIARSGSAADIGSITDTQGNTYTVHASGTSGVYPRLWLYSAVASSTGPNTVTCGYSPAGTYEWCEALEYNAGTGATWSADSATRYHVGGVSQGSAVTDIPSTAITSTTGGALVLGVTQSTASSSVYTAGTDFTLIDNIITAAINFGGVQEFIPEAALTNYVAHITGTQTTNYRNIWGLFRTSATGGVTVPTAPTIGTATGGNTQASVTFTAPTSNGGAPITLYTATSTPGSLTGTATTVAPITVTGLTNGTPYTFTVTATNSAGTGPPSAASNSVTPAPVPPSAPTIGTATAGNAQATVTFTASASNGGATITGYTATSNPGGQTGTGAGSPITVTGLSNGNSYTFTVTATNSAGTGPPSAASNAVTPVAPQTVPNPPLIGTATGGNAQASVTFTAGGDGGSTITGFTVTSAPGNLTGTGASSPIVVAGLTNGTPYSFTVVATNAIGNSNPSASSNQVTPATIPTAPTIGTATAGATTATVTFTPNADGGSPVTVFTATSSPGAFTGTGGSSPISVAGLSVGVGYTFTVTATNALGTSAASAASNSVTLAPTTDATVIAADQFHLLTAGGCYIRSGSGAPAPALGTVCDQYFRTDSPYTVYRKTNASTWAAISTGAGGTAPYTQGDVIIADSATTLGRVAPVAFGSVLRSAGVGVAPVWTTSPSLTAITSGANLTLSPAGDVILGPAGNDILPSVGYTKNIGTLTNKFLTLHAAELWVETLVAQNTIATIGGRVLVGPTTSLTSDLAAGALFITVKHNQIALGDTLYLEANGAVEFLRVTSASTGGGPFTYAVVRNLDGSGPNNWTAGDAVFNTGTTGDGFIDLYSASAVNGPAMFGPTIAGRVRTSDTLFSSMEPRWAIGNLNGQFGYGQDIYGAAFGDGKSTPTGPWLKVDANTAAEGGGGIRAGTGATTYLSIDPTGNAWFAGNLTVGTGGKNMLANSEFIRGRATGDRSGRLWGGMASATNPDAVVTCAAPCTNNANPDGLTGFDNNTGLGVGLGIRLYGTDDWVPVNGGAMWWTPDGIPGEGTYTRVWGPQIPVRHGQWYEFSFYAGVHRGDDLSAHIIWLNSSGIIIGETDGVFQHTCDSTTGQGGRNLADYCRAWAIAPAPTSAIASNQAHTAVPTFLQIYGTNATGIVPFTFATRAYFGEAQEGQTEPSPWGPAGTTLITGSMLSTDLVMANTMRSMNASNFTTGTGFWLDATGLSPTFRVGNPAGNRLSWDGTHLTVGEGTFTVDSTGIRLSPTNSTNWIDTSAYRFDVTNGQLGMLGFDYNAAGVWSRTVKLFSNYTVNASSAATADLHALGANNNSALISAQASNTAGFVALRANTSGTANSGAIELGGVPKFMGATSSTATAGTSGAVPGQVAGYINITVGTTNYRIPVYNP